MSSCDFHYQMEFAKFLGDGKAVLAVIEGSTEDFSIKHMEHANKVMTADSMPQTSCSRAQSHTNSESGKNGLDASIAGENGFHTSISGKKTQDAPFTHISIGAYSSESDYDSQSDEDYSCTERDDGGSADSNEQGTK